MTFTDDDLKRVKEMFGTCEKPTDEEIKALIARLEAAEKVILGAAHNDDSHYPERYCEACQNMGAWRKACGK